MNAQLSSELLHVGTAAAELANVGLPFVHPSEFSGTTPAPTIVIACTFDPLGLTGPLTTWLKKLVGFRCTVHWVGYGMVFEAVHNQRSAWGTNRNGLNVLLLRWTDLDRCNAGHTAAALVEALRHSSAARIGSTLVLIPPCTVTKLDEADDACTVALRSIRGLTLFDADALRSALDTASGECWLSPWLDRVAHAPYSPVANSLFASLICCELVRVVAPKRKCICLDCDNTLWGGAVGEVGAGGVELSEAYLSVQRRFVSFQERGALLCLISRNHEADVRAVLSARQAELTLKAEHVVAVRAAWDIRKGDAILELARTLSLDPASFLFVDDSAQECAEVHATCAHRGVGIVQLPRDPRLLDAFVRHCWTLVEAPSCDFDVPTHEDATRTTLYRELDERRTFVAADAASATSMHAFAASLGLRVDISALDGSSARRAAQLTERTNQHNAYKGAASEAGLLRAQQSGRLCLVVEARDRFGAHGLVGLIVAEGTPGAAGDVCKGGAADEAVAFHPSCCEEASESRVLHVRGWLLSCRSLHLGIEHAMMHRLAAEACARGATHLGVHWRRAERNEHAAAFLFSMPGATFLPLPLPLPPHGGGTLGLEPLEQILPLQPPTPSTAPQPSQPPTSQSTALPSDGTASLDVEMDVAAAAEAAVRSAIDAGRRPTLASLPAAAELDTLQHAERRKLTRKLTALVSRARLGELSSGSTRAEAARVLRGRIGGELCRHTLANEVCTQSDCPFVHGAPAPRRASGGGDSAGGVESVESVGGSSSSAAARGEEARLRDVVGLSVRRSHIPNRVSNKMLNEVLVPLGKGQSSEEAEAHATPSRQRPAHGIIMIPVASAAAVSFEPAGQREQAQSEAKGQSGRVASTGAVGTGAPIAMAVTRAGFESSSGSYVLHYETVRELAEALSTDCAGLHAWVSDQSERSHPLPDAFREVWMQSGRQEPSGERQPADVGDEAMAAAEPKPKAMLSLVAGGDLQMGTTDVEAEVEAPDALDARTLQARLRSRLRHAKHDTMQKARPEGYYKDAEAGPL